MCWTLKSRSIQQLGNEIWGFIERTWICRKTELAAREVLLIWHVLPGASTVDIKRHVQEYLNGQFPESFGDRIIFMSMFNSIDWTKKGNKENCLHKAKEEAAFATKFKPEHWCFLGPASESTLWNGHSSEPQGRLDVVALPLGDIFKCRTSHSDISSDRAIIAWTGGDLRMQFPLPRYIWEEDSHQCHIGQLFTMCLPSNLLVTRTAEDEEQIDHEPE